MKNKRRFAMVSVSVIVVALILEAGILKYVNDANAYKLSKVLLDRVFTVLDKNDQSEEELIESLKDDYIVRAKAVSYIVDAKPQVENDVEELQKIAKLMSVDEIHLFDETGCITSGSVPKYFGYSFDSGTQMSYFKPMLTDKSLTMCQDVTPNTSEGKAMMYSITWNEAGTMMVQVGLKPQRLLDELKQNEISTVVSDMPVYKGMELYVADADTELVKGATACDKIGKTFHDLGFPTDIKESDKPTVRQISVNDSGCRCIIRRGDKYIVAVTIDKSFYMTNSVVALLVVGIYLILASCCIMYMFSKIMKEKYEKEKLLYISNTDALTGCLNRHAYETDINKLDLKKEWIYISLDLNSLKHINDTYGHDVGDEMICAAAACMTASFGEFGKVYRIGGDEFVVIVTQKPDELDAMTKHFDSSVAEWRGKIVDSMTISYGCVRSLEEDWELVHDIEKEADRRMYASKARYYSDSGIDRRK
ncbi:GGDEF domain-containing protein [Agathobacter rectalis]|jgi:diguanylate cyclase (GGDEF)-like protein|uniref:GGDEF domain-containing protein n=1 Tax=Agathobacter rectalis TaxID=39491 RepID=UPI0035A1C49E